MKKFLAIILISLVLLSSCAVIDSVGDGTTDNSVTTAEAETTALATDESDSVEKDIPTKPTDYFIITECVPYIKDTTKESIPKALDSVIELADSEKNIEELYDAMKAHELTIPVKLEARYHNKEDVFKNEFNSYKACIIDKKEEFKAFFEALTLKKFDDFFPDDFFENNFIIFFDIGEGPDNEYYSFEYGLDSESKTLKLRFNEIEHEGWQDCLHDSEHTFYNFVMIPKADMAIDGKLIPYDELNVIMSGEFTYN